MTYHLMRNKTNDFKSRKTPPKLKKGQSHQLQQRDKTADLRGIKHWRVLAVITKVKFSTWSGLGIIINNEQKKPLMYK